MDKLQPPDSHHASAAMGWLELGDLAEARVELAKVGSTIRQHPDLLEVAWAIESHAKNWPAALEIARELTSVAPGRASVWLHLAYSLRRVPDGGLEAAWKVLVPAAEKFPRDGTIAYNLACYACQLGQLDAARNWLQNAIQRVGKAPIKKLALEDEDLQPLWSEIKAL